MAGKTKKAKGPSKAAMAAAEQMLAPLLDLLKASVKQNEMNAQALTNLNAHIVKIASQLDALPRTDPKLLTEPAPQPPLGGPLNG